MPPTEVPPRLWLNNQLLLHHNYAHFTTTTRSCPIPAAVQHATLYQPNACAQCLHAAHQVDCTQCACEVMPNACCPTIPRWYPMLALSNHLKSLAKQVIKSFPAPLCKWKGNGLPKAFLHLSTRAASTISNADVNKSRSNRVQYNIV